jgi:alkylation response protein AidB-like acyl-CoA dehydrogenase
MAGLAQALDAVDKIADVIRADAADAERAGQLTPRVEAALREANLFRVVVGEADGGLGLTIPETIELYQRVAACDASTAWVLAILAGGPRIAKFVGPQVFERVNAEPMQLMAATLNPAAARAEPVDGGYIFSGKATYLSGSAISDWVMVSALLTKNGTPVFKKGGITIRSGVFPITDARALDTWHVTGMRATNSTDYEFDNVFVAEDWSFEPLRGLPSADDDVFAAIPIWAQLGHGLSACAVGAARNMIDRFLEVAVAKIPAGGMNTLADRGTAQIAVGKAEGCWQAARAVLAAVADDVWARGVARAPFDNRVLAEQRAGSVTAVQLSMQVVDLLHDAAGMSSVMSDSVLERCWRDVHTITQHVVLGPARFEVVGRVLLGLAPESPVI